MAFGAAQKVAVAERRASPRRRVMWGSFVTSLDGSLFVQCTTRDISATGARVEAGETRGLPATVCYLDMRHRLAYEARVAWKSGQEAGLEFLKCYRFDEVPSQELRGLIAQQCQ